MTTLTLFEIGGCVRDSILGTPTKDIDFAVEMDPTAFRCAGDAFAALTDELGHRGFTIFVSTPEFFTLRAKFPKGHAHEKLVADFVLCRKDGPSSNARHPDFVEVGTLLDDQERRDFTMNAIAKADDGTLLDPFGGQADIARRVIRFVGDPEARLREDALRALRGLRFSITKGMRLDDEAIAAIRDPFLIPLLASVSKERMREELDRMFRVDTLATLDLLASVSREFTEAIFDGGLRLKPTQEA